MKTELKATAKRVLNFSLVLMLVFGLFASLQQGSPVSADPGAASQPLDGGLHISQGDTLHVSTLVGEPLVFNLELADPPSNGSFTWQVQAPPRSGVVTLAAAANRVEIQYSPAPGFTGEDLFSVLVSDAAGNSDRIGIVVNITDAGQKFELESTLSQMKAPANKFDLENELINSYDRLPADNLDRAENGGVFISSDPVFQVYPVGDYIYGYSWTPNVEVTLTIDNALMGTEISDEDGWVHFDLYPFDIHPGQAVKLTDGTYEETHTVTNVTVTEINQDTNSIRGTAEPLTSVNVEETITGEYSEVTADINGDWEFTFTSDIGPGYYGYATQIDSAGNMTCYMWKIINPSIVVLLNNDQIMGYDWPVNTEINLAIGTENFSETSNQNGWVSFYNFSVDIHPGLTVDMSAGSYFRSHTVKNVSLITIDEATETLSGTADPGEVNIQAEDSSGWIQQTALAGDDGNWSATLTGIDVMPGVHGWVTQYDTQGNSTEIYWKVLDPYIFAFPKDDDVEGRDWLPGTSISLTIDDPATAELDYSVSRPSYSNGDVKFSLYGFDLLPGHIITMTDGSNTRTHIVTKAAVKSILTDVDKVKGVADPYSALIIYGNDRNSYEWLYPTADSYGKWAATFTKIDIKSGTYGWVYQYDVEGNATLLNWNVPNPYMRVYPQYDDVSGSSWTPNTTVKIFVDGIEKKSTTSNASGSVYFSLAPFDLKTGQVVKMTDGVYTRTHTVLKIKISGYDLVSDTITGTAKAGSQLTVLAWDGSGYYGDMRYPVADASGVWVADFSTDVDIEPGSDISAWQYDPAGNSTYVSLSIPNPNIGVYLGSDSVSGSEWTPGNTITVNIDGNIFTKVIDTSGHFYLNQSSHGLDLQPGQLISASDGVTTKDLTIADVKVTSIDQLEDTLTGTADANSEVHVVAFDEISYGTGMMIMSDPSGIWNVDFSGYEDMAPGTWGFVQQLDEDGDFTDSTYEIYKVPVVFTLSPTISAVGADPFTLTVNGENFYPASRIIWDGVELDTMFISNGQLSAVVPAEKLVSPMAVSIQVFNPEWGGGISDSLAFKVIGTLPQFDQKLITSKVTFDWEDVPGATNYKIQLSTKKDFSILLVSTGTVDSSYAFGTKLAYNTVHYWRIKPKIGGFWQPWSPVMKFTSMDPLAKPLLLSPEPGAIITSGNTPTLDWDPVTNGFTYLVQISKLADFSTTYFKTTTDATEFLTNPLPKGKYYWRVRAIDASGGKGPWSEVRWFKITIP